MKDVTDPIVIDNSSDRYCLFSYEFFKFDCFLSDMIKTGFANGNTSWLVFPTVVIQIRPSVALMSGNINGSYIGNEVLANNRVTDYIHYPIEYDNISSVKMIWN